MIRLLMTWSLLLLAAMPVFAQVPVSPSADSAPASLVPSAAVTPPQPASIPDSLRLPALEQSASLVLQVGDREAVSREIIRRAEAMGGWFVSWEEWGVTLRIPAAQLKSFLAGLDTLGRPLDRGYSTMDRSSEIEDLRASIESRRKLLDEYFAMVRSSASGQVQVVERETVKLVAQIERDEGRLRGMESRIQESLVRIDYRFSDRNLPPPDGNSPFAWMNHLNLADHREVFQ